jgi:hypothetical protein
MEYRQTIGIRRGGGKRAERKEVQIKNEKMLKKVLILLVLTVFPLSAGKVALVRRHFSPEPLTTLCNMLERDGHKTFGVADTFVDPLVFDVYWILPDETLTEENIVELYSFVCGGGHLILIPDNRSYMVEASNRIFEYEPWFEDLGRPQAYNENVYYSAPDTFVNCFGFVSSSFIVNFDPRWKRGMGIDTLVTVIGVSVGVESVGCLRTSGWGGRDCYGHPYVADTAVYDSFAVQILSGDYRAGEITVVADRELFISYDYGGTDVITLFDNLQFARQLFACNTRADSAAIEQADSTFRVHLHGDFTDFNPDSCEWKFRILHVWPPYQFRGHELGARFIAPDILEIDNPPIHNPVYDTVEVCLMFLPDYRGETVLWDFPVCDTFKFNFSNIAETPTPQSFAISAHPNPFNSSVTITAPAGAEIEVFDVNGRRISVIPDPDRESRGVGGELDSRFHGNDNIVGSKWRPDPSLGSGVYLVRARFGACETSCRVVYLK